MAVKIKRRWEIIKVYIVGWTLALLFLSIIRGVGTTENGEIQIDFFTSILFSLFLGPSFGSISGLAQIITEEKIYKRISIQKLLLFRLVFSIVFLISMILVVYFIFLLFFDIKMGIVEFAFDGRGSFPIYGYIIFVDFFMAVYWQINLMLGPNKLIPLIRGKFYTPSEEERVFMFLDLQSSTHLAEILGHINYSRLIQDLFNDLGVVIENDAEIYQYVGDGVILTWPLEIGLLRQNCVAAFFTFKNQLLKKREYYVDRYNCSPVFKAGVNAGLVTVTEVGKYKKEIAYHGDTINTAARLQSKCNEFNEELLISGHLKALLQQNGSYAFKQPEKFLLRGKQTEVTAFPVVETIPS